MISFHNRGNFNKTEKFLKRTKDFDSLIEAILHRYGQLGVAALSANTPVDSGLTAASWDYEIERGSRESRIIFTNSNVNEGVNIAIILQYGHGTGTGGYVEGRDYINPAIQPIFDGIAEAAWKEVTAN